MNPYLNILASHAVVLGYLVWYVGWCLWRCYGVEDVGGAPEITALEEHWEAVQALEARAAAKTMEAKLKLLGVDG